MSEPRMAPYGSWKSPITSDLIASGSVGVAQPLIDGDEIYWIEMRPTEGGRSVIVNRTPEGSLSDINPAPFNARTRVHEYGGGDYAVSNGKLYFSNFVDQRLYVARTGTTPEPITPAAQMRYADMQIDNERKRLICVREDHSDAGKEAVNTLVTLSADGNENCGAALVSGNDFYSSPRLSADGTRLAWLTWNHPNMPWDGTELWVGTIGTDGLIGASERIAGGPEESIFQPEWSPDGKLYFVSDRSGWWNFYRVNKDGVIEQVNNMPAEFGAPQWGFGMSSYAFVSADEIYCAYVDKGISRLGVLDTRDGKLTDLGLPYTDVKFVRGTPDQIVFRAGSPSEAPAIVRYKPDKGSVEVLRRSSKSQIDAGYISAARAIDFPTEGGMTAHGFFYPPTNAYFEAPAVERPPLLVMSHGGPTASAATALSLTIQYWTSRGIAVLDVNYGGSGGFGREYRERLKNSWGIVDVDDCTNGARYLEARGEVDGERLMITGGSAGGYTTLCALTFRDAFNAGASYYGVSDVEALAKETHKFESRYLDRLMGPYPKRRDIYFERSPINFTERLSCPVIFFQGLEDKVVPPNQAEAMVEALKRKGIPVAYLPFEGEQHGFRQAKNIKRALDGELYFYSRVFGFELADAVEPVEIKNLSESEK